MSVVKTIHRSEWMRLKAIERAARDLSENLESGFVRCSKCGEQEDTKTLDFHPELRDALRNKD